MKRHGFIGWLCCASVLLLFAGTVLAQPVIIQNVPDWNQPATYGDFVQPFDPPPAAGGVANWCSPTAASNVMGWLEDRQGFTGLADGKIFNNFTAYKNNDTNAGAPDGLADFQQNQWRDGTIELGYYMDTQDWLPPPDAPPPSHTGTLFGGGIADCPNGIQSYLNVFGKAQWTMQAWNYDQFNGGAVANSFDDYRNGGFMPTIPPMAQVPNNGIDFDDPTLVTWDRWINIAAANQHKDDVNEIIYYDWTGSSGMAHTVTGVGYVAGFDPDGDDGPMPFGNWLICHDGKGNTGHANTGHVAVPWNNDIWWGNTHVEVVPEPFTLALLMFGSAGLILRRKR